MSQVGHGSGAPPLAGGLGARIVPDERVDLENGRAEEVVAVEKFSLRDASGAKGEPLVLRPLHLALAAFAATAPLGAPALSFFSAAPQFGALSDNFVFSLLLAALLSAAVILVRGLQRPRRPLPRVPVTAAAVAAYLAGLFGAVALLFVPSPWPALMALSGLLAGAALPLLAAEWGRAVAGTMSQALVLAAFVVLAASFGGWVLTLLPLHLLVPAFCVLSAVGTVALPITARVGGPAAPMEQPSRTMADLISVTWLPLAGLAVYAFMTNVLAHSAFGVVRASFLGGVAAAVVMFGVCFLWGRRPLLPWSYRILVPIMAAAFVVLGAFPVGTFPRDASVVAVYVFYIVLAMLGVAVLLAVIRGGELPANVAVGFGCAVAASAGLVGQILSGVLAVTDDFGPWIAVLTAAFVAVLMVFLGRTSWTELVTPREDAARDAASEGGAQDVSADEGGDAFTVESSVQDTLEARCADLSSRFELSPRESEILVFLARGFSPAYIAKSLVLSVSTVRTHVRNIYRKLGVGKREELIHLVDETDDDRS